MSKKFIAHLDLKIRNSTLYKIANESKIPSVKIEFKK